MNFFARLSLVHKLVAAFTVVIAVFMGAAGVSLYVAAEIEAADAVNASTYRAIGNGTTMLQALTEYASLSQGAMIVGKKLEPSELEKLNKSFDDALKSAQTETAGDDAQQRRLAAMASEMQQLQQANASAVAMKFAVAEGMASNDEFLAQFAKGNAGARIAEFREQQQAFNKEELKQLYAQLAHSGKLRFVSKLVTGLGALLAIFVAAVAILLGVRTLRSSMGGEPAYAASIAREIAAGNLHIDVATRVGDTTSVLAAMKSMRERLAGIVSDVRRTADGVAVASAEISTGNADLSSRTEQQASALEETAASMEELGSTVHANADNARQANQLAVAASQVATEGGAAVGHVVETMKGISESSRRIADIIGVIDGIAFQTNILALNAAVEAARAGEQGRGFAVVASEVRSLAQRSADAAKEIKSLITASVEQVELGTAQVDKAGTTIQEVVTSIRRVTDIVGEISSASVEQAAGVTQVAEAVTDMDRVTQQNAALVEQSAAAAESLKDQAQKLVTAMSAFRTEDGALSASARVADEAIRRAARAPSTTKPAAPAKKAVAPKLAPPVKTVEKLEHAQVGGNGDWETF